MKKSVQLISLLLCMFVFKTPLKAQDWANLKKYQKENLALLSSKAIPNRVVFMGNSITEGWGEHYPEFFKNPLYINRGISGQTTPQMLLRFKQDVVALQPTIVVILAGINDIAGNTGFSTQKMIEDNIFSMVEIAQAHTIKVILCSVLPANRFPWRKKVQPAEKVIALNKAIKAYALKNNIVYVDYFSLLVDAKNGLSKEYTYDGVHPNTAGYKIMSPLVEKAIKSVLKKK